MRKLAKTGTEINPGRAQWRIFPECEKYYSILNKYFQSLSARASPALLKGSKSPGSATWSTMGTAFSSKPLVLPWAKINWQVKHTMSTQKPLLLRRNPPLEQEACSGTECLNAFRLGGQPSWSHPAESCFRDCNQEHLYWSISPEKHHLLREAPLNLFGLSGYHHLPYSYTQAQASDRNEPRCNHWSHLQRAKWSLNTM